MIVRIVGVGILRALGYVVAANSDAVAVFTPTCPPTGVGPEQRHGFNSRWCKTCCPMASCILFLPAKRVLLVMPIRDGPR